MKPIFWAQWMKEKRSPYAVLIFCAITIVATLLFGSSSNTKLKIDAFLGEGVTTDDTKQWIEQLNENGAFQFKLRGEEQAVSAVREGRSSVAVKLLKDDYRIIAASDNFNVDMVRQHLQTVYTEKLKITAAALQVKDESKFHESMSRFLEQPPLTLHSSTPSGGVLRDYDMGLQLMFGFTLFLVMFTVGFKVNAVTSEKVSGIWNRVILSPVTKTQMYLGHLTYSTLIGIIQITIIFLLFHYGFGYDLGNNIGMLAATGVLYVITIVAMSMLFTGLVKTPEQFITIFTSIVPIMPLISGVYMAPGTITNDVLLFIAQLTPLQHAMDALLGAAFYHHGWTEIYLPLAKLLLMAVIFFGVGINLVERRRA
ncbi:ABC transporter permease [Paenibacillus sp. N1-5-1-14]|uniref:ABC transporter permease n=1 Tax=Paenibacillus radicibacter TaxID=2972488 RepID=UPI0021596A1C|nr:ABC transporter permease [Paenibacillus radicibacter]MCR8643815.1 ABC transporter permease [Paenibacillus radicibacter]